MGAAAPSCEHADTPSIATRRTQAKGGPFRICESNESVRRNTRRSARGPICLSVQNCPAKSSHLPISAVRVAQKNPSSARGTSPRRRQQPRRAAVVGNAPALPDQLDPVLMTPYPFRTTPAFGDEGPFVFKNLSGVPEAPLTGTSGKTKEG
jgi:hypothetical protein